MEQQGSHRSVKILLLEGQRKVGEFRNWSVNLEFDIKSGNFDL